MNARRKGNGAAADNKELMIGLKASLTKENNARIIREMVPKTLGKVLTPERVVKIVLGAASRNPQLLECTTTSIMKSVAELVGLGLEPGSPLGEGYLVPFWNSKIGAREATAIPGYRGLIVLARRSGQIKNVCANIVYERDDFSIDLASGERPTHRPCLRGERGDPLCVYSVAEFADGGYHLELMTINEVNTVKSRSKSADRGPWVTDWGQMARKTVIRRASKYWPMSVELADALALDSANDTTPPTIDGGSLATVSVEPVGPDEPDTSSQRFLSKLQQGNGGGGEVVPPHDEQTGEVADTRAEQAPPQPDLSFEERAAQHAQQAGE